MSSTVWYSNGLTGSNEIFIQETAWVQISIKDSLVQRTRLATLILINPQNIKQSIYTQYLRVKIVEAATGSIIFLGRVITIEPSYDSTYGSELTVNLVDYVGELFQNYVNRDYTTLDQNGVAWTTGHPKRSDLIKAIVTNYTYPGSITTSIEASGNSDVVTMNYLQSNQTPAQIIETLAVEDYWTDETWGAAWLWNNSAYVNDTIVANSGSGTPFSFLGATTHYFYLGQNNPFLGAYFNISALGNYGAQTWQYYNGVTWSPLTLYETFDFKEVSGTVMWEQPIDWKPLAFSNSVPEPATPPDATSRYYVRVKVTSVTSVATIQQIICEQGCGYDYFVDDQQVFHYFKRGSQPSSGNYLTIQLGGVETTSLRAMTQDYAFCDDPIELVTQVTCYGTANDGTTQQYVATNATLAAQIGTNNVVQDFVWGNSMTPANLLTYVTKRANALLNVQSGPIVRGTFSFYRYPYAGVVQELVRVGDVVKVICSPQNINDYFLVLSVTYNEPPGQTTMETISLTFGRGLSPFDLTSVLQGLTEGQNVIISCAQISDLTVNQLQVKSVYASALTAGAITVGITTGLGGSIGSGTGTAHVTINPSGFAAYNSTGSQTVNISSSGSGWFGNPTTGITWDANGDLLVPGNLIAGTIAGVIIEQAAGAVVIASNGVTITGEYLNFSDLIHGAMAYMGASGGTLYLTTTLGDIFIHAVAGSYLVLGANGSISLSANQGQSITVNSGKIINLLDPTNPQDAATKNYVDTHSSGGGSIIPSVNNTYSLGSPAYNWANAYITNIMGGSGSTFYLTSIGDIFLHAASGSYLALGANGSVTLSSNQGQSVLISGKLQIPVGTNMY